MFKSIISETFGGNHVEFHTSPIKELQQVCQKLLNIRVINKLYL
jgi:hypothetical protein